MAANDVDVSAVLINAINNARALARIETNDPLILEKLMRAVARAVLSSGGNTPFAKDDAATPSRLVISIRGVVDTLGLAHPTPNAAWQQMIYGNEPSFAVYSKLATVYGLVFDWNSKRELPLTEADVGNDAIEWSLWIQTSPSRLTPMQKELLRFYDVVVNLVRSIPRLLAISETATIKVSGCSPTEVGYIAELLREEFGFGVVQTNDGHADVSDGAPLPTSTLIIATLPHRVKKLPRHV